MTSADGQKPRAERFSAPTALVPMPQRTRWPSVPLPVLRAGSTKQKVEATVFGECLDRRGKLWRVAAVFAATSALAISGCASGTDTGGQKKETTTASAQKVDDIANTVPESIKSTGKLVVGVNIPYAPNEFKDPSGKIVGFDVDLMNAIAATLGLTADYREADFAKIIPSIQGGTFNVGMSSFTDTKEREQSVDFVTYFSAGILWAQRPGSPIDPKNACGKKVAVQATTTEETDELPAKSKACTDAGKPAIQIVPFDGQDAATNAVVLGQVDAMSADSPVTLYAIKQSNGKLEAAGDVFDSAPYGWPVQKGSPLAQSLQKALQHLIDSGTYKQIASNWGVEKGMIDKPVINGAIS
jgi:polar amino acid transport system substrate-binding protein